MRHTGVSIAFNVGGILGGALAPLILIAFYALWDKVNDGRRLCLLRSAAVRNTGLSLVLCPQMFFEQAGYRP